MKPKRATAKAGTYQKPLNLSGVKFEDALRKMLRTPNPKNLLSVSKKAK